MTTTKALKAVEIKDEGRVRAVFATFNVKDHDGDVTLPGAFEDGAPVRISAFGHASWGMSRGASSVPVPPVGKGVIRTTADEAILDGQFFLKTTAGADHYELVKEMGDQQEWSYGYDTLEGGPGEFKGETVNLLRKQLVHEVSPVLLGAGIGTRTLEVKSGGTKGAIPFTSTATSDAAWDGAGAKSRLENDAEGGYYRRAFAWVDPDADPMTKVAYKFIHHEVADDGTIGAASLSACAQGIGVLNGARVGTTIPQADRKGVYDHLAGHLRDADREPPPLKSYDLSFPEEAEYVLGGISELITRAEGWGSGSDTKAGRVLSAANHDRLSEVAAGMTAAMEALNALLAETDPQAGKALVMREYLRFEHLRSQLSGGTR